MKEFGIQSWGVLIRVWGEPDETLKAGLVKMVRDGFIYPLARLVHGEEISFILSDGLKTRDHKLLIECWEEGGGYSNTGQAIIICGCNGEKMIPFFIPQPHEYNGRHAHFSLEKMVSITAVLQKGSVLISIKKHRVKEVNGNGALRIETKVVWEGNSNDLPTEHQKFREATLAAVGKVKHFHCREPHFIAAKTNDEPRVYVSLVLADSMFGNNSCQISRTALTMKQTKEAISNSKITSCCNSSHEATIKAIRERFGIEVPISETLRRVHLNSGDSIIVINAQGLPRITDRREYISKEVASATFTFSRYTIM